MQQGRLGVYIDHHHWRRWRQGGQLLAQALTQAAALARYQNQRIHLIGHGITAAGGERMAAQ